MTKDLDVIVCIPCDAQVPLLSCPPCVFVFRPDPHGTAAADNVEAFKFTAVCEMSCRAGLDVNSKCALFISKLINDLQRSCSELDRHVAFQAQPKSCASDFFDFFAAAEHRRNMSEQ